MTKNELEAAPSPLGLPSGMMAALTNSLMEDKRFALGCWSFFRSVYNTQMVWERVVVTQDGDTELSLVLFGHGA